MDWDKLRIFQAVADAGSFTHAGETLKLSQSAISRQIGALEEQLGVMLFHRHARGLILTEQGELLYRTARDMAAKVNTAEALLRARALEAGLAYELIASRSELDLIVAAARRGAPEPPVRTLGGWRRELVGADLRDLLAGRGAVSVGPRRRLELRRTGPPPLDDGGPSLGARWSPAPSSATSPEHERT